MCCIVIPQNEEAWDFEDKGCEAGQLFPGTESVNPAVKWRAGAGLTTFINSSELSIFGAFKQQRVPWDILPSE